MVTAAQLFRGSARRRPDHEIKPFGFNFVVMAAKIFRGSARRRYHEILRRPDHEIKTMTMAAVTGRGRAKIALLTYPKMG